MNDPILIDFDRLIQTDDTTKVEQKTLNFQKIQLPELERGEYFTSKSDILLLGFIIYYIYYEKIPTRSNQYENTNKPLFYDISNIEYESEAKFFSSCFLNEPNERPTIDELFHLFDKCFYAIFELKRNKEQKMIEIFESNSLNNKHNLYFLGKFYFFGLYATYPFSPNSKYLNSLEEKMTLAGKSIIRDIDRSIYYYCMAANQNSLEAQTRLGDIYYDGEYVPKDINKAIHYYSLAVKNHDSYASFQLGNIYKEGKYVPRDIDKAIHYFQLASYDPDYSIKDDLESDLKN
ncbi:hypothetical protein M9Y10_042619 [Tritrichomonas musculus]|uniref:Protein kinase domain-containing protein n=1 Tax=Tritrichomonas musculus TaxID=1915356 RepID=A0ABR2JXT5_9EUKA